MKEQSIGDLGASKGSVKGKADSAGQEPVESKQTQGNTEPGYITVASRGKNVRKTTYFLVVLFSLGALCLWFMIKKSGPSKAEAGTGAEESQIEIAIARLTGVKSEMFSRMDEILNKFYEFSDVRQVKVNDLVKNPFRLEVLLGQLKQVKEPADSEADAEFLRLQMLKEQAKRMQLLSIMQTEQGYCCMINDRILYKGDSIREFQVKEITDNTVELQWNPSGQGSENTAQPVELETIILRLSE
jgi:hypothetical protein